MSLELEYRRGQALSAISAAEERFRARDFPAAWMLALQARSFFPSLLGLHSAITAYDVLRRSAAAPKLPPGKSGDWRDVLDAVGGSPDHDAVEARYRNLCTLLTDPARTEFAAAAADEALKIVEQAWREFKAGQSPKSHPGTAQSRSSSSDDFSGMQVDSFTPKSPTQEKMKRNKMPKPPLTGSSSKELTTKTAVADIGKKLVFSGRPSKPTMSASCPRCDDWFRLVVVGRRLYLSCIGCGRCYSPRCGQCRGLHKPKHVSGRYVLLVCGDDCRSPVLVGRVTRPSSRLRTATLADGAPSHVVQSSIYGRSRVHVSYDE